MHFCGSNHEKYKCNKRKKNNLTEHKAIALHADMNIPTSKTSGLAN